MSSTRDFVACRDGRIIPVPSGVYVHDRPVGERVDVLGLAVALVTHPMPGVVLVHLAPDSELSPIVFRFTGGLSPSVRDFQGIVLPRNVLENNPDAGTLEAYGDRYDSSLILPMLQQVRSARAVALDRFGRESHWDEAVAVRLLTRLQAAGRASVIEAVRVVSSGQAPSLQRLADWSSQAADIRDAFQVLAATSGAFTAGTVQHAFGAYLARYAQARMVFPEVPQTVRQLCRVVGGTFEPVPAQALSPNVRLVEGSASLVSFKQAGAYPDGIAWLFAGAEGRLEMEPRPEDVGAGTQDEVAQWLEAVLAEPSTWVMGVDGAGAPATVAALIVPSDTPVRQVVPEVLRTGGEIFADPWWPPVPANNDLIVNMVSIDPVVPAVQDRQERLIPEVASGREAVAVPDLPVEIRGGEVPLSVFRELRRVFMAAISAGLGSSRDDDAWEAAATRVEDAVVAAFRAAGHRVDGGVLAVAADQLAGVLTVVDDPLVAPTDRAQIETVTSTYLTGLLEAHRTVARRVAEDVLLTAGPLRGSDGEQARHPHNPGLPPMALEGNLGTGWSVRADSFSTAESMLTGIEQALGGRISQADRQLLWQGLTDITDWESPEEAAEAVDALMAGGVPFLPKITVGGRQYQLRFLMDLLEGVAMATRLPEGHSQYRPRMGAADSERVEGVSQNRNVPAAITDAVALGLSKVLRTVGVPFNVSASRQQTMETVRGAGVELSRGIKNMGRFTEFVALSRLKISILEVGGTGDPVQHVIGHARSWIVVMDRVLGLKEDQSINFRGPVEPAGGAEEVAAGSVEHETVRASPPLVVRPIVSVPETGTARAGENIRSPLVDVYVSMEAIDTSALSMKIKDRLREAPDFVDNQIDALMHSENMVSYSGVASGGGAIISPILDVHGGTFYSLSWGVAKAQQVEFSESYWSRQDSLSQVKHDVRQRLSESEEAMVGWQGGLRMYESESRAGLGTYGVFNFGPSGELGRDRTSIEAQGDAMAFKSVVEKLGPMRFYRVILPATVEFETNGGPLAPVRDDLVGYLWVAEEDAAQFEALLNNPRELASAPLLPSLSSPARVADMTDDAQMQQSPPVDTAQEISTKTLAVELKEGVGRKPVTATQRPTPAEQEATGPAVRSANAMVVIPVAASAGGGTANRYLPAPLVSGRSLGNAVIMTVVKGDLVIPAIQAMVARAVPGELPALPLESRHQYLVELNRNYSVPALVARSHGAVATSIPVSMPFGKRLLDIDLEAHLGRYLEDRPQTVTIDPGAAMGRTTDLTIDVTGGLDNAWRNVAKRENRATFANTVKGDFSASFLFGIGKGHLRAFGLSGGVSGAYQRQLGSADATAVRSNRKTKFKKSPLHFLRFDLGFDLSVEFTRESSEDLFSAQSTPLASQVQLALMETMLPPTPVSDVEALGRMATSLPGPSGAPPALTEAAIEEFQKTSVDVKSIAGQIVPVEILGLRELRSIVQSGLALIGSPAQQHRNGRSMLSTEFAYGNFEVAVGPIGARLTESTVPGWIVDEAAGGRMKVWLANIRLVHPTEKGTATFDSIKEGVVSMASSRRTTWTRGAGGGVNATFRGKAANESKLTFIPSWVQKRASRQDTSGVTTVGGGLRRTGRDEDPMSLYEADALVELSGARWKEMMGHWGLQKASVFARIERGVQFLLGDGVATELGLSLPPAPAQAEPKRAAPSAETFALPTDISLEVTPLEPITAETGAEELFAPSYLDSGVTLGLSEVVRFRDGYGVLAEAKRLVAEHIPGFGGHKWIDVPTRTAFTLETALDQRGLGSRLGTAGGVGILLVMSRPVVGFPVHQIAQLKVTKTHQPAPGGKKVAVGLENYLYASRRTERGAARWSNRNDNFGFAGSGTIEESHRPIGSINAGWGSNQGGSANLSEARKVIKRVKPKRKESVETQHPTAFRIELVVSYVPSQWADGLTLGGLQQLLYLPGGASGRYFSSATDVITLRTPADLALRECPKLGHHPRLNFDPTPEGLPLPTEHLPEQMWLHGEKFVMRHLDRALARAPQALAAAAKEVNVQGGARAATGRSQRLHLMASEEGLSGNGLEMLSEQGWSVAADSQQGYFTDTRHDLNTRLTLARLVWTAEELDPDDPKPMAFGGETTQEHSRENASSSSGARRITNAGVGFGYSHTDVHGRSIENLRFGESTMEAAQVSLAGASAQSKGAKAGYERIGEATADVDFDGFIFRGTAIYRSFLTPTTEILGITAEQPAEPTHTMVIDNGATVVFSREAAIGLGLIEEYLKPDGTKGYRRGPAAAAPATGEYSTHRAARTGSGYALQTFDPRYTAMGNAIEQIPGWAVLTGQWDAQTAQVAIGELAPDGGSTRRMPAGDFVNWLSEQPDWNQRSLIMLFSGGQGKGPDGKDRALTGAEVRDMLTFAADVHALTMVEVLLGLGDAFLLPPTPDGQSARVQMQTRHDAPVSTFAWFGPWPGAHQELTGDLATVAKMMGLQTDREPVPGGLVDSREDARRSLSGDVQEFEPEAESRNAYSQPEGYDLDVFRLKLQGGVVNSVGAAFGPLWDLSVPELRLFAGGLRARLADLRVRVLARLGAGMAGKDLWGSFGRGVGDGALDSLGQASVDSVREQVAQMLAGYDFARVRVAEMAGWGVDSLELAEVLPSVELLVADVLPVREVAPGRVLQDRLVPVPEGRAWVGRVLPLGLVSEVRLGEVVRWAEGMVRPVIVLGTVDGEAAHERLMGDLRRVLRWFAYEGVQPVVQVLGTTKLKDVGGEFRPVVIERTTVGLEDRWVLYEPDGLLVETADVVTRDLFDRADRSVGVSTGYRLPAVLLDWLALTDPLLIEWYLYEHLGELVSSQVSERMEMVAFEDAGVHRTVLNLVLRNGGPVDAGAARFVPGVVASRSDIAPLHLLGAVPETFAVDYLRPQHSLEQRKGWNDQLVRLVDLRTPEEITRTGVQGLSVEEMLALAVSTQDEIPGEVNLSRGLATAFTGLSKVLRMSLEKAAGPVTATEEWHALLTSVATCHFSPAARQILIYEFDALRNRLSVLGRAEHAALVGPLTDAIGNC